MSLKWKKSGLVNRLRGTATILYFWSHSRKMYFMAYRHMPINLTEQVAPKTIKMNFGAIKTQNFRLGGTSKP